MNDRAFARLAQQIAPSRRSFLIGAAAAGSSLVVGFSTFADVAPGNAPAPNPFSGYLQISPDETVTIYSSQMDMGQGIYHGIATLVQEELDADWAKVSVVGGFGNPALYGNLNVGGKFQFTGGSSGTTSSWERYRRVGATARAMIVATAAEQWNVPVNEISTSNGVVSHAAGKSTTYGALVTAATTRPVPGNVALKEPQSWKYVGAETLPRYDLGPKSTGRQQYTIDLHEPGMLTAVMIHPPRFGAALKSFDGSKAKEMKGVVEVVATPRGVAVVASGMWEAMKAREAVTVEWDESKAEKRSSNEIIADYRAAADKGGEVVAANAGDVDAAFAKAAKVLEAGYEFPCRTCAYGADQRSGEDELRWNAGGLGRPSDARPLSSSRGQSSGHHPRQGDLAGYENWGRFWTSREPGCRHHCRGGRNCKSFGLEGTRQVSMDPRGRYARRPIPTGICSQIERGARRQGRAHSFATVSLASRSPRALYFEAGLVREGVDRLSVEGIRNLPYAILNVRVDLTTTKSPVPVLWWRAVGSTHTAYALESFIDEIAHAAGRDPVEFRLAMLKDKPRHAAVLQLAAEKAGWSSPAPTDRYRGIAFAKSFHSYVAQVAEISVDRAGQPKVHRVVCAVDCGTAVNPDQVRAQMEGGIGFGLGAILKSQLTLNQGMIVQGNFDGYDVLRIDEMPKVEVHIVKSTSATYWGWRTGCAADWTCRGERVL